MKTFAVIESGVIVNAVLADDAFASSQGWQPMPPGAGIGWTFDGSTWAPPAAPSVTAEAVRAERNKLLADSDWVVIRAVENGSPVPGAWIAYRQGLRDITQQAGFPGSVVWPVAPGA